MKFLIKPLTRGPYNSIHFLQILCEPSHCWKSKKTQPQKPHLKKTLFLGGFIYNRGGVFINRGKRLSRDARTRALQTMTVCQIQFKGFGNQTSKLAFWVSFFGPLIASQGHKRLTVFGSGSLRRSYFCSKSAWRFQQIARACTPLCKGRCGFRIRLGMNKIRVLKLQSVPQTEILD